MFRTALGFVTFIVATTMSGVECAIASVRGIPDAPGGPYDRTAGRWSRMVCWATGVDIVIHGQEHLDGDHPRVFVANHVSWFDIFTLMQVLPHHKFVAKAELRSMPLFGWAATKWGVVWIERENRRNAFAAYESAALRIKQGVSVAVYPEGTRGDHYELRQFKKGPFVLAIASGVPIVPTVIHGSREVHARTDLFVKAGTVHLHFLPAVSTAGLSYDERNDLARRVRDTMAECLDREYGVKSVPTERLRSVVGVSPRAPDIVSLN